MTHGVSSPLFHPWSKSYVTSALKAERQNNNSLIQILRVILMRRAGNSFLQSECTDSREKNDPQVHGILGITIHRDFLCS